MLRIGFFKSKIVKVLVQTTFCLNLVTHSPPLGGSKATKDLKRNKRKKRVDEGWAVWGRMTGGDVWSPALCPEARCDRMAQVKRGAIKEFNFVPRGGNWGFEKPRLEPSVSSV